MNIQFTLTYDDILARVVGMFQTELGQPTVDAEDDFFDAGGDSLMAENLILSINEGFDRTYDVSSILDYPTPQAFARELSKGSVAGDLIGPIDGSTGKIPYLHVHGAHGDNYQKRLIGDDIKSKFNVAGIRASGLVPGERLHGSLDEMVDEYYDASLAFFGETPVILSGFCAGSLITLELASKIYRKTGKRLTIVALDPPGSLYEYHQNGKGAPKMGIRIVRLWYYLAFQRVLKTLGLDKTRRAQKVRRKILFERIRHYAKSVHPEPFPCNLLIFTGPKMFDVAMPGFLKWAHPDSVVRGIPMEGHHNIIHIQNREMIDAELLRFVDDLKRDGLFDVDVTKAA